MQYRVPVKKLLLLPAIALALLLVGCTSSSEDDPARQTGTAAPEVQSAPCETTDLTASVAAAEPGNGQRTVGVRLANGSSDTCSTGTPAVQIHGAEGPVASAGPPAADRFVEVPAGESAYVGVTYTTNGTQSCEPGEQLVITPAGESSTLLLPLTLDEIPQICADSIVSVTAPTT